MIDEEVSDNVVRIFNIFLDGKGYAGIAKTLQTKEFFHLRNTDSISQERLNLLKSKRMALFACKRDTPRNITLEILFMESKGRLLIPGERMLKQMHQHGSE